jgi:hypothetical protein
MNSLFLVRKLISDFILDKENISGDTKLWVSSYLSSCIAAECTSLETARVFITMCRLEVAIPEDLANALQAEANLSVDDPRAGLAQGAEGVHWSEFTPEPTDKKNRNSCVGDPRASLALEADPTDNTAFPRELADVNEAKATTCVDDPRAGLAPGAEGVHWSEFPPEPTDYIYPFESRYPLDGDLTSKATRDHSEDCTKLGDDLTSTVVNTMRKVEISKFDSADADETSIDKDAIDSHDQKVSAGGFLASATSIDVELPLKVLELGPFFAAEGLQMPRAVQPRLLSPEHLSASVPAAPNISYQRSLPTIDGVKCALKGFLRDANPGLSPWPCCSVPRSVCPAAPNYAEKPDFAHRLRPYRGL